MAAGLVTITIKDGANSSRNLQFWSSDGTVDGDLSAASVQTPPLSTGAATAAKQDSIATGIAAMISALGTPFQAGGSVVIGGTLPAFAATPTFNLGTLNGAATSAKQDALLAVVTAGLPPASTEYETIAAAATDQVLGSGGAAGDLLVGLLIIPATTSPGAITIKDGGGSAITVFTGGASSVSGLVPFFVPLGIKSNAGAWKVTTGANVSAIGVGDFT